MLPQRSESPEQAKSLNSWKEIAAFLVRAERTVKRWEYERGLPVHRVPGGERGRVFAYPDELSAWLKGKSSELEADEAAGTSPVADHAADPVTQTTVVPVQNVPVVAADTRRWNLSPARVAAWVVPLALAAALIYYFSGSHNDSRVTAVGDRESSNASVSNLAPDSVAVLPFTNVGSDASSNYLSDGITESLIDNLAHIPRLKVRSRDAVYRLKAKDLDVEEAGNELGVPVVVTGRLAVQTKNIEVSAELTDVRDNTEIWGKRYTGKISDLIPIQERIAGDIAEQLRSTLSAADRQQITRQGTQNIEAYTLYLKGRYGWNQRDRTSLDASIPYFNQAILKDPDYALAYSALADVYSVLPYYGANTAEDFPKANIAARTALRLDPTLAHPHAILGSIEMDYDWDFAGGEAEFRKALALDPNDATAHQWFARSLGAIGGREQDALKEIDLAHRLDPASLVIGRVKGGILVAARRYDDAIAVCGQLLVNNPNYSLAHDCLGYAYWGKHMYSQAEEQWTEHLQHAGNREAAELVDAQQRGFRSGGWRGALAEGIKVRLMQRRTGYVSPYQIARSYADLGDNEKAFEWLNTAYREHDFMLREMNASFEFDNLRSDPRFAELVRKIGLPKLQ